MAQIQYPPAIPNHRKVSFAFFIISLGLFAYPVFFSFHSWIAHPEKFAEYGYEDERYFFVLSHILFLSIIFFVAGASFFPRGEPNKQKIAIRLATASIASTVYSAFLLLFLFVLYVRVGLGLEICQMLLNAFILPYLLGIVLGFFLVLVSLSIVLLSGFKIHGLALTFSSFILTAVLVFLSYLLSILDPNNPNNKRDEILWGIFNRPEKYSTTSVYKPKVNDLFAGSLSPTKDKGYVIAGNMKKTKGADLWVGRLDGEGKEVWGRTYEGTGSSFGRSAQQTADGGYIVGAELEFLPEHKEYSWILKLDGNGNMLWDKKLNQGCSFIIETRDGKFLAGCSIELRDEGRIIQLIKLDEKGNVIFDKKHKEDGWGKIVALQETRDGGYIAMGNGWSTIDYYRYLWILKLDTTGATSWIKTYREKVNDINYILQKRNGGFAAIGDVSYHSLKGFGHGRRVMIFDEDGNLIRSKIVGGMASFVAASNALETPDEAFIIIGEATIYTFRRRPSFFNLFGIARSPGAKSVPPKKILWILRIDKEGREIWQKFLDRNEFGSSYSLSQTGDGVYTLALYNISNATNSRTFSVLKFDQDGKCLSGADCSQLRSK